MAKLDNIDVVHQRRCTKREAGRCNCAPSFRVQVWDPRARRLHRKTFRVRAEAITWRDDVRVAVRNGTIRPAARTTVLEAADAFVAGMADGSILDRTGKPYKPSTRRSYKQAITTYLKRDPLATLALSDTRRADVQDYVDRLRKQGLSPSTIANKLDPLRVIYRRAVNRDEVTIDPTKGLALPAVRGKRDRIASPAEAAVLIEALPVAERSLWATALYAGLRRGELRALAWACVDFDAGVIRVEWGWDDVEGRIEVKSDAGRRTVPLIGLVRKVMAAHKLATGRDGEDLVFGRTAVDPFTPTTVRSRALKAWGWKREDGKWVPSGTLSPALEPLTPHEARHCAASYLIAAGLNPKQLSVYIGHSDIRTTYNRYGHLMPGGEAEAAAQLDRFFGTATGSPKPDVATG
jgi:integrase